MSLDAKSIRADFPIFARWEGSQRLVYLDNAATVHKPRAVLAAEREYYERFNSNVHRSVHRLAEEATELYETAREFAGLTGNQTVYDLYCGIGTIGLLLARDALTVWGIDVSEESIACALENAELNGIGNAAYFAGNVGQALEELHERAGDPDVVVVDPPRAGLAGKALKRLGEIGAPRIVYVSCNPTTLAGDVKRLRADYDYELERVKPVDMFPHTPHVEAVALLGRHT